MAISNNITIGNLNTLVPFGYSGRFIYLDDNADFNSIQRGSSDYSFGFSFDQNGKTHFNGKQSCDINIDNITDTTALRDLCYVTTKYLSVSGTTSDNGVRNDNNSQSLIDLNSEVPNLKFMVGGVESDELFPMYFPNRDTLIMKNVAPNNLGEV